MTNDVFHNNHELDHSQALLDEELPALDDLRNRLPDDLIKDIGVERLQALAYHIEYSWEPLREYTQNKRHNQLETEKLIDDKTERVIDQLINITVATIREVDAHPLFLAVEPSALQEGVRFEQQLGYPVTNQNGRNDLDQFICAFFYKTGLQEILYSKNPTTIAALKQTGDPRLSAMFEFISILFQSAKVKYQNTLQPYTPAAPKPEAPSYQNRTLEMPYIGLANKLTQFTQQFFQLESVKNLFLTPEQIARKQELREFKSELEQVGEPMYPEFQKELEWFDNYPQVEFYPTTGTIIDEKGVDAFLRIDYGNKEHLVDYLTLDFTLNATKSWEGRQAGFSGTGHKAEVIIQPGDDLPKIPRQESKETYSQLKANQSKLWDYSIVKNAARCVLKAVHNQDIPLDQLNQAISDITSLARELLRNCLDVPKDMRVPRGLYQKRFEEELKDLYSH